MSIALFHRSCKELDGGLDQQLGKYITATQSLKALSDPGSQKVVAVGLKGIGKSSAYRYLTEFDIKSADVVVGINPDNYTLQLPQRNLHYAVCRKQFEHDLVAEALRSFVAHPPTFRRAGLRELISAADKRVGAFLKKLKAFGGQIKGGGLSIVGCGFTVQRGQSPTLIGLIPDKDFTSARDLLGKICQQGMKIRIIVDDPELVFAGGKDLDVHLVGGFCLAALRLSAAIPGFKVVGFLKTHVYHPVSRGIEDLSKYPDHMARLSWDSDELELLIAKRLEGTSTKWTEVFTGAKDYEAKEILSNMISQVRNGPRDLLRWIDLALRKSGHSPIGRKEINDSRVQMSCDALTELGRAHSASYEQIDSIVRTIFASKPEQEFTHHGLCEHIEGLLVKDRTMKALSALGWLQRESSETLPQLLFQIGALSFRSNNTIILPYQENYTQTLFDQSESIMLTPGLRLAVKAG